MTIDLSKYPKQIFWSDEDEGFIAIAPDLPGCSAFGETEVAALAELDNAIEAWVDAARSAGNAIPAPSRPALRKEYSGKLLVRMPQSLHHELANAAKREDVSLNQFIVFVLSRYFSAANMVDSRRIGNTGVNAFVTVGRGPVMFVGTNYWTALTEPTGMNVTSTSRQLSEECQSWNESLGKGLAFYGKVHDEVARNIIMSDTFSVRSRQ